MSAKELLAECSSILVFTGAGLSTASGIPDFRGPDGVWTRVDPAEFTYQRYVTDAAIRERSWKMRKGSAVLDAEPNDAHRAITGLWNDGRMAACVTQNIDGLHQAAGLPPEAVVELHGSAHTSRCLDCTRTWPTRAILERVDGGDADPRCTDCGGIIKASVVSFGEQMPVEAMELAFQAANRCDAVISAGSTLGVYPAADVPLAAARRGVPYVIVNQGETAHDAIADAVIAGDVTNVLPAILQRP